MPHGYAYETLTAEQKTVYDEVYRIILAHDSKVKVSTCDEKVLEKSYRSVIADHGGIFWVSGYNYTQYTMGKKIVSIDFSPSYTMERTERDSYQRRIDAVVDSILKMWIHPGEIMKRQNMCLNIWRETLNIKWGRNKIRISSVSFK